MGNRELQTNVKVSKERVMQAIAYSKTSIRKMAAAEDDKGNKVIDRSDSTLREYLKSGYILPDVLDRIAQFLDVDSSFLSGELDWPLEESDDKAFNDWYRKRWLQPQFHPYRHQENRQVDYQLFIKNVLKLHGVSFDEYSKLPRDDMGRLDEEIDCALTIILRRHHFHAQKCNRRFDSFYEKPTPDLEDLYDQMVGDLVDQGILPGPFSCENNG